MSNETKPTDTLSIPQLVKEYTRMCHAVIAADEMHTNDQAEKASLRAQLEHVEGQRDAALLDHQNACDVGRRLEARLRGAEDSHRRAEEENDKLRSALLAAAALLDRWRGFDFDCPDEEYDDDSDTYDEDGTALAKLYEDTSTFRASPPFGEPGIVT